MANNFERPHFRIDGLAKSQPYKRPKRGISPRDLGRETERHAEGLKRDLAAAWADADGLLASRDGEFAGSAGRYIDFETLPDQPLPDLSWKSKGVRLASAARSPEGAAHGTIFVPENAREFLEQKLDEYREKRSATTGRASHEGRLPHAQLEDWDSFEIEDPAHAWNILTVGGYTDKGPITDAGFEHWPCAVEPGSLSPYSRVSSAWYRGVAAIKPELVFEAGNKGVDSADSSMVSGIDSLSLLTTSRDPITTPLTLSWATSAATAQLAGLAACLLADDPELWPETVRALLVHSAKWAPSMETALLNTPQKSERLLMLRRFGYGVPDVRRALRSASNSLALVAQQQIQPFAKDGGKAPHLNEAHFYVLPWPRQALLDLGEHDVRLRVTLSYFVEPKRRLRRRSS